jgi:predicted ATP-grasp superfamily ATP-dependent carboligase
MVLAEAASNICRIVWVIDSSDEVLAPLIRLLRRLGDVVDSAGLDADGIAAELAPYEPGGIFTFAEDKTPLTAELSHRLSLVYHSLEAADRLADKYLQRHALHNAGMPGPAIWKAPNPLLPRNDYDSQLEALIEEITFPVVVKPRRGTGSAATVRANDREELLQFLARFEQREGGLLVELLLQRGRVSHMAITGKFKHAPPFRGRGCFLPSDVDASTERALFEAAETAVLAIGLTDGFANVDMKLTPGGPRIMEVNGRLGGKVHDLIELAGGPSILPLVFRLALGDDVAADPTVVQVLEGNWQRIGYYAWVQGPMSALNLISVDGLDEVAALSHVSTVIRNRNTGDSLDWSLGGHINVCAVFGSVENYDDLVAARDEIDEKISLEFEVMTTEAGA